MSIPQHIVARLNGSTLAQTDRLLLGTLPGVVNNSSAGAISSVSGITAGSYATLPTLGTSGNGSGATLVPVMKVVSETLAATGSGYTANDVLTVSGGTSSTTAQITVDTVDGSGHILTAHVSRAGSYTVLPTSPISVTGGTGTAATFTLLWGLLSVTVSAGGSNFDNTSALTITGGGGTGGGAGTLVLNNNGNSVTVAINTFTSLPTNCIPVVNPGQDCRWYVPQNSKTSTGFNVVLVPTSGSVAIAAGTFDVAVFA